MKQKLFYYFLITALKTLTTQPVPQPTTRFLSIWKDQKQWDEKNPKEPYKLLENLTQMGSKSLLYLITKLQNNDLNSDTTFKTSQNIKLKKTTNEIEIGNLKFSSIVNKKKACKIHHDIDCTRIYSPEGKNILEGYSDKSVKLFGMYKSPSKEIETISVLLRETLFEYNLLEFKPFPWNFGQFLVEDVSLVEETMVVQPYFFNLDGILKPVEESFDDNGEAFYNKMVLTSVVLKRGLKLLALGGGLEHFNCIVDSFEKHDEEKENFLNDISEFENGQEEENGEKEEAGDEKEEAGDEKEKAGDEDSGIINPFSHLNFFIPKVNKNCDAELFMDVPLVFENVDWDSFGIRPQKFNLEYKNEAFDFDLTIESHEIPDLITNRKNIYNKLTNHFTQLDKLEKEENGTFKMDENVELIKNEASNIYGQLIRYFYKSIKFSPLIIPISPLITHKKKEKEEEKIDTFIEIVQKFEHTESKLDESEKKKSLITNNLKYRKHAILKSFLNFTENIFKRYFVKDIKLFVCFQPTGKFQYDTCPIFIRDLIKFISIHNSDEEKIEWRNFIDLTMGYTFANPDEIKRDFGKFVDFLFLYAKSKLKEFSTINGDVFIEENLKMRNEEIEKKLEIENKNKLLV